MAHDSHDVLTELDIKELGVAKRKLSDRQRVAIRKDIRTKLALGVPRHDVVKSLSAKFQISPISVRWHIRTLLAGGESGRTRTIAGSMPAAAGDGSSVPSVPFTQILNQLSDRKLRRLLAAKKLVPELDSARRHESELRGKIRDLERQLHAEESKARVIEQRIKRLSGF